MTRRNLFAVLFLLTVMALTLRSILHETHPTEQYGMARIRLSDQTIYVKSRRCNVGCAPGIWLSHSSDRCKPPNPANDYSLVSSQVLFARQGNTLTLVENASAVARPTAGDWIDLKLVPPLGSTADKLALQAIMFGPHLPTRNVPVDQVELGPCIRAFGHDWAWL